MTGTGVLALYPHRVTVKEEEGQPRDILDEEIQEEDRLQHCPEIWLMPFPRLCQPMEISYDGISRGRYP